MVASRPDSSLEPSPGRVLGELPAHLGPKTLPSPGEPSPAGTNVCVTLQALGSPAEAPKHRVPQADPLAGRVGPEGRVQDSPRLTDIRGGVQHLLGTPKLSETGRTPRSLQIGLGKTDSCSGRVSAGRARDGVKRAVPKGLGVSRRPPPTTDQRKRADFDPCAPDGRLNVGDRGGDHDRIAPLARAPRAVGRRG